jgi:hypothetical protein
LSYNRVIGSGTVVAVGLAATGVSLFVFGQVVGWAPTWRAIGVTPLQPPFFDMHVINDYLACAWKGIDPYAPRACSTVNFNIPRTWLALGYVGIDGSDSGWLSLAIILAVAIVIIRLHSERPWYYGVIALSAVVSPSVMMGIERGNLDLLILALVGSAALIYKERSVGRVCGAIAFVGAGVALKLFPMFCISLVARCNRQTVIFAGIVAALSFTYLALAIDSIFLIRRNVPTTFVLSYGYKAIFLGIDHMRSEAGLRPLELVDTWMPAAAAGVILTCSAIVAVCFRHQREFCAIGESAAGTAFLFGAGIYCGTYLLGTNFIYRLMFLLLCVPQLLDWQIRSAECNRSTRFAQSCLLATVLGVLWLNGNANGHSTFLLLPQLLNWFLFFCLASVLALTVVRSGAARRQ